MTPRISPTAALSPGTQVIDAVICTADADEVRVHLDTKFGRDFAPPKGTRDIPHRQGSTHTPGYYWCSTDHRTIPYESWLEMRWLQLLDHDPRFNEIMTQPLTIHGADKHGTLSHTPDIFARSHTGTGTLIDVKAPHRLQHPDTIRRARLAASAASAAGWDYHLLADPPPQRARTVSWLAGARTLPTQSDIRERILDTLTEPLPLRELWMAHDADPLAKPATFHLLWHDAIHMDYRLRLSEDTMVWRNDG